MSESSMTTPVVLVVEDEALVRMLAVDVLEEAGFEVIEAPAPITRFWSSISVTTSAWCSRTSTCPVG